MLCTQISKNTIDVTMPIQGMDKGDCIDKTTHGIVSISDIDKISRS